MKEEEKFTNVSIKLNRASLGDAEYIFALVDAVPAPQVAYVPRKDVTVTEQPIMGERFSAKLMVRVVEENENGFVVETEDSGNIVRWNIDREGRVQNDGK